MSDFATDFSLLIYIHNFPLTNITTTKTWLLTLGTHCDEFEQLHGNMNQLLLSPRTLPACLSWSFSVTGTQCSCVKCQKASSSSSSSWSSDISASSSSSSLEDRSDVLLAQATCFVSSLSPSSLCLK